MADPRTLSEALEEIRRLRSILQDVLEAAKGGEPLRGAALEPKTRQRAA